MENNLHNHKSEQNGKEDSITENFNVNGDEYEDFVVMCPACGQAFSSESGRLKHDFDNCMGPEPSSNSMRFTDSPDSEENSSDDCSNLKKEEFTDDVQSLQSEYGKLFDNKNQLIGYCNNDVYNSINRTNNSREDIKPQFMQAPLIPLLPKPSIKPNNLLKFSHNGIGPSFPISKQAPETQHGSLENNYFHFKRHELQKRARCSKVSEDLHLKMIKKEEEDAQLFGDKIHDKSYECDECGRVFVNLQGLSHHKVTHNGSKPYQCVCGRSYTTHGNLKAHQKTHSGVKPYNCDECTKTFTTKQGLIYHRTLHTGSTPYKCEECGKGYSYSVALNAHKKTHMRMRLEAELAAAEQSFMNNG